jgi:hypothetical protein
VAARLVLPDLAPTTVMTGNVTQLVIDAVISRAARATTRSGIVRSNSSARSSPSRLARSAAASAMSPPASSRWCC